MHPHFITFLFATTACPSGVSIPRKIISKNVCGSGTCSVHSSLSITCISTAKKRSAENLYSVTLHIHSMLGSHWV